MGQIGARETTPRVALVTGAGKRIGRAIALALAADGWRVGVHYRSAEAEARDVADAIASQGGVAAAIGADLADADAVATLVPECARRLGAVTCLVNNASLFLEDDIVGLEVATWDLQMAVNLRAPILLSQAFARQLPADAQGAIVNILDQRVLRPQPGFLSYAIAKEGLYAATRMLAQALAPRIRVNGVGPGPVLRSIHQSEADFAEEARGTLLGRAAEPDEIAKAVRFILDAPSLTGQMIAIDGGQHLAWTGTPRA
jgi:NAD(P)-dependent dehydrogenase (short-subunit alcohol dehydrogenase family)